MFRSLDSLPRAAPPMPHPQLEAELRDLVERILRAGRQEGERAAAERMIAAVRTVATAPARGTPGSEALPPEAASPQVLDETAAPSSRAVPDRLPPYWRPR